jgi:hypothetical protein
MERVLSALDQVTKPAVDLQMLFMLLEGLLYAAVCLSHQSAQLSSAQLTPRVACSCQHSVKCCGVI